ncbi:MAG: ATP-dependent DNA helicase RecQ [Chitinophagaceae bacterium]
MNELEHILYKYWGYDSFRPLQERIINSVLEKKDTLALLPTGGGKSICFQVPALAREGICLVISPLIALMKDQVENLKKRGISALAIYSGQSKRQIAQTLKNAAYGNYKLLYVSPERLDTGLFNEFLPALGVNLIAVDEAHCISQWGYDFRPAYMKIADLRKELPSVPVLALTASATAEVQKDICARLQFEGTTVFRQSYERKNLSYSSFSTEAKQTKLVSIIKKVPGSAIVYCKSRKRTVELASLLAMHGLPAQFYHAGLNAEERSSRQQNWVADKVKIMVCTNAFGMGIDKPDVRLVIHADLPDCLENYYQEAGRAGRDGRKSYAVLLHDERDNRELTDLHQTRYPTLEEIRKVYSALVNFLQVPVNYGEDQRYTFRFEEFVRNFKLKATQTLYALKALEADGWIYFNEKSFTPTTLVFTSGKEHLRSFLAAHPMYKEVLTALLRTYEGIIEYPALVSEHLLAQQLRLNVAQVQNALSELHAFSVVNYTPQVSSPQIIFLEKRPAVKDLTLNLTEYNKRKAAFINRAENMVAYTRLSECRSAYINHYFGDTTLPCGICDTCLEARKTEITPEEFKTLYARIEGLLTVEPHSASNLLEALTGFTKEKVWKVIGFMQSENRLQVHKNGMLYIPVA